MKKLDKALDILNSLRDDLKKSENEEEGTYGGVTEEEVKYMAKRINIDIARDKIKDVHKRFDQVLSEEQIKELKEFMLLYKEDHIMTLTKSWECSCGTKKDFAYRPATGLKLEHLIDIAYLTGAIIENKNQLKKEVDIQRLAMYVYDVKYVKHICSKCEIAYRANNKRDEIRSHYNVKLPPKTKLFK